jgi:hypothetical protein
MTTGGSPDTEGDGIRAAAAAAIADVNALGLDGEDRKVVLDAVLQARLSAAGGAISVLPIDKTTSSSTTPTVAQPPAHQSDILGRISQTLKLDRHVLELVYDVRDGEPQLVVSPKRLAQNKAEASRQLATLLAAARQAAGLDEWTTTALIRNVVSDYGKMDSANFAANLQQMDKVALIRGKGQQREIKMTRSGMEEAAALITLFAGAMDERI